MKTIELADQLSYCLVSPNEKFLCYSLLDNSIKVVFEDTQKNFLSLYGHKVNYQFNIVTCTSIRHLNR